MPRAGELIPRPLLNFRCNYGIEASNVGEDKLPILVDTVEKQMLGMGRVSGKGSSNHSDFPSTVFVEIDQDRINAFELIQASKVFTRKIGQFNRNEPGFNHLLTLVGEAQIDSILPRPLANVEGVDQQLDFEMVFSSGTKEQVNRNVLTLMGKTSLVREFNIVGNEQSGTVIVSGTTGQSILSVNSIVQMLEEVQQGGAVAETFNITCTVTELVRA